MNLSVYGHAFFSVYTFMRDGKYEEVFFPGGALYLGLAGGVLQKTEQNMYGALKSDVDLSFKPEVDEKTAGEYTEKYRRDYSELYRYSNEGQERGYYAISRYLGYRDGSSIDNIYFLPPDNPKEPADLIVWDEGFGGLQLKNDYRSVVWASNKAMPDREQFKKVADKCFLFLDADVLRSAGAIISRQISWERTTSELIRQLHQNEAIAYIMEAPNILVPFAEDGAVYIHNAGGRPEISLVLTHGGAEGTTREKSSGSVDTTFVWMTLVLASLFGFSVQKVQNNELIRAVIECGEGIRSTGYKLEESNSFGIGTKIEGKDWPAFTVPLVCDGSGKHISVEDDWTITDNIGNRKTLSDVAFDYVLKGPEVINGLPQLSFGALTTIDRWEIEAYQNIRNLIVDYSGSEELRPLSIAVFGAPGSGKSFGVTQIALNVLPGKAEKLEFNVSQFTNLANLSDAFQNVRDTILLGKLPVVFFDEFDSDREGIALGWIKSFLMPMQDGKFMDESGSHPLGKCILVFAGGTASSFEHFVRPLHSFDTVDHDRFKSVKGPDFVSRLRGTIDVLGPNPKNNDDKNYILRRALLLRSLCGRKLDMSKNPAPISAGIIRAMLLIPEYKYGARSMEAIFNMSRITGGVWEPVSLPSHSQLSLHVDAGAFIDLVHDSQQ